MPITEAAIRDLATAQSYERGANYYYTNSIGEAQQRGNILLARVEGSELEPYDVTITLNDDDEIVTASCSCPYHWGGFCKHLVAVLLLYVRQPNRIEECASIQDLLADTDESGARGILSELLQQEPRLIDRVEAILRKKHRPSSASDFNGKPPGVRISPVPPAVVQPASLRRHVQQILRDANVDDAQTTGAHIVEPILELLTYVHPFLNAKDGRNALLLLRATIEPVLGCWYEHKHDSAINKVFFEAGPLFHQAIVHADLSAIEQAEWQKRFQKWQTELTEYGILHIFDEALEVIRKT